MASLAISRITGSAPILLVRDVVASANYYRDKVGFNYDRFWGEPPCFCILWRDSFHLMLSQVEDTKFIVPHYKAVEKMWNVYFWVSDADSLYKELEGRGHPLVRDKLPKDAFPDLPG